MSARRCPGRSARGAVNPHGSGGMAGGTSSPRPDSRLQLQALMRRLRLRPRADLLFRRNRGAGSDVKLTGWSAFQSGHLDTSPQATDININVPHLRQCGFIASDQFIPTIAYHVMV